MNKNILPKPCDETPSEPGDDFLVELGEISELTLGDIGTPIEGTILNRRAG